MGGKIKHHYHITEIKSTFKTQIILIDTAEYFYIDWFKCV